MGQPFPGLGPTTNMKAFDVQSYELRAPLHSSRAAYPVMLYSHIADVYARIAISALASGGRFRPLLSECGTRVPAL